MQEMAMLSPKTRLTQAVNVCSDYRHLLVMRFGAVALAGLVVLGLGGTPVKAQYMPGLSPFGPGNGAGAVLGSPLNLGAAPAVARAATGAGFGPYASLAASGYANPSASLAATGYGLGGYGGWGLPYTFNPAFANPFFGYLQGVADVTTANANYWKTIQEARLLREQSYRSALETRRKIIEEADWERGEWLRRIDPNTNYQKDQAAALDRARHDPPVTEILSARALNDLFRHLSKEQGRGERGPNIPLDQDLLKGINLTGQDSQANPGLLKDDGKLQWPLALESSEFKDSREQMNKLIADAVNVARFGNAVDPGKLKDMKAEMDRLNNTLTADINELSPSQYIAARRYLNQLDDAVRALEDPKVGNYFNQNWAPKGKNVAELIKYMSDKGLRFAPAVAGDTDAYRALYHALQAFDAGMIMVASRGSRGPG
jgi:hypothetical protein